MICSAAAAETIATFFLCPLELAKLRVQARPRTHHKPSARRFALLPVGAPLSRVCRARAQRVSACFESARDAFASSPNNPHVFTAMHFSKSAAS
eukprot:6185536-Pleurochrysis_carterae.AAC.2